MHSIFHVKLLIASKDIYNDIKGVDHLSPLFVRVCLPPLQFTFEKAAITSPLKIKKKEISFFLLFWLFFNYKRNTQGLRYHSSSSLRYVEQTERVHTGPRVLVSMGRRWRDERVLH